MDSDPQFESMSKADPNIFSDGELLREMIVRFQVIRIQESRLDSLKESFEQADADVIDINDLEMMKKKQCITALCSTIHKERREITALFNDRKRGNGCLLYADSEFVHYPLPW